MRELVTDDGKALVTEKETARGWTRLFARHNDAGLLTFKGGEEPKAKAA